MSTQTSLKKTKIFHPFLVAIFPVMVIYSENIGKVEFHELILPIVLTLVFSFSLFFILKIILKNPFKAGVIVTLTLILLFSYGHLYYLLNDFSIFDFDIGRNRYLIPLFGIIFSISVFFTIKTKRLLNNATSILNVVSIVFLIVACSNLFLLAADFSTCEKCAVDELFYETKDYSNYFTPHTFQINERQIGKGNKTYIIAELSANHNQIYENAIKLITSQTDYSEEEAVKKLEEWNGNYLYVIKEYLNPNFLKKKEKKKQSVNHNIMKEIRTFMDSIKYVSK